MTPQETKAIVTLSVMAAFVDGEKHERERSEIKRIAEGLSQADGVHLPTLYQDVLTKRVSLAAVVADLASTEAKLLAYEMAVCVCHADGTQSPAEQRFLDEVRAALDLGAPAAAEFSRAADELATVRLGAAGEAAAPAPTAPAPTAPAPTVPTTASTIASSPEPDATAPARPRPDAAELDRIILNAAILNGALELLPETLSTMAIIPLQMKLVFRIGQLHGYELDRGHIKDFLATAGVGLTSQFMEQAGRKLLGGLLGSFGGGIARGVGQQAVSSGLSFASTYALGHVAARYYGGGRTLSTQMLKDAYASVVEEGRRLQTRYLPAMQEKARTLDTAKVLATVRGA